MPRTCLPCVVATEGELLALVVHKEAVLNPYKSLSACDMSTLGY